MLGVDYTKWHGKLSEMENLMRVMLSQINEKRMTLVSEDDGQKENVTNFLYSKKVNSCGHQDKEHYAKGMCSNCYHKYGRTKKPWNCPHEKLYANGMCQNCYINTYNRKRR